MSAFCLQGCPQCYNNIADNDYECAKIMHKLARKLKATKFIQFLKPNKVQSQLNYTFP
jgi:hypothetical protein